IVGLLPAIPVTFTLAIFATAEIRVPSILQTILVIGSSILYGGLFVLGGAICGAVIGAIVFMFSRDSRKPS
ncbi:MAG: hypothetical protein ACREEP_12390, partial [Dongiaceae bacterium]